MWIALPLVYEKWRHPSTREKHYRAIYSNGTHHRVSRMKYKTATAALQHESRFIKRMCAHAAHASNYR